MATEKESSPTVEPFIPASQSLPEITIKALVLGVVLSAILAGANAYLGLKVGMTVSASIPAAVISMAVLRLFRKSNILENNIVQTAASAGESVSAGIIFTLPALLLLGYWNDFQFIDTMAIAAFGGTLGVLFTVPLRRALIVEANLKFPEGVATGEVLKAGSTGAEGVKAIGIAAVAAALLKLCQTGFKVVGDSAHGSLTAGRSIFGFGSDLSVALLAVGYIVGLNIAVLVFAGGLISWLVGIPVYTAVYGLPPEAIASDGSALEGFDAAGYIWSKKIRYMGVGAMVVGGIWALISLIKPIASGVRSSLAAMRASREGAASVPRTERDTPLSYVLIGLVAMAIPLFFVFNHVIDQDDLGISSGLYWSTILLAIVFALLAGFLFTSVAGYMAGLVGSSNNPISGVTIATILTISLILLGLLGSQIDFSVDAQKAVAAAATAILVGAVVCCAAAIAGDNMQDLKAGQIVGATPYKQQIMQIVGTVAGALAVAPILSLLFQAYGLGGVFPREGMNAAEALAAPQATLMQSVAQGVFARNLEWTMIFIGCAIAVAIIILDQILKAKESDFRTPVLAVAVGIYLPISLSVPIFVGGLIAHFAGRYLRARKPELGTSYGQVKVDAERHGLLFASGLITGEALIGILLAIPFAASQSTEVMSIPAWLSLSAEASEMFGVVTSFLGVAVLALFSVWLYTVARKIRRPVQ